MTQAQRPLVHRECALDTRSAGLMARAVVRARLTAPGLLTYLGIDLVGAAVFLATGPTWLGVALVAVVILVPLLMALQLGRLSRALAARGFAAGTRLAVDWGADNFVVTTSLAHATYFYRDLRSVKARGGVVIFRLRTARLLVLLPAELVPPAVSSALAAGRLPR
jgi:hypothetical protein